MMAKRTESKYHGRVWQTWAVGAVALLLMLRGGPPSPEIEKGVVPEASSSVLLRGRPSSPDGLLHGVPTFSQLLYGQNAATEDVGDPTDPIIQE